MEIGILGVFKALTFSLIFLEICKNVANCLLTKMNIM
jgi:hypothetical protein